MTAIREIECVYGNQYRIKTSRKYDLNETYKKVNVHSCDFSNHSCDVGRIDNLYFLQDFTVPVWVHTGRNVEKMVATIPHCTEKAMMERWRPPIYRIEYSENARRFKDSTNRKDLIHSNLICGDFNTLHFFAQNLRKN